MKRRFALALLAFVALWRSRTGRVVQRTDLDPRSARTVAHRDLFVYDRGAFAE